MDSRRLSTKKLENTGIERKKATEAAVAIFLNKLSGYLFTVARVASRMEGQSETVYQKA